METLNNKITLATTNGCSHCNTAKLFLKKYAIPFQEMTWNEDNEALFTQLNIERVPVLLVSEDGKIEKIEGENAIKIWASRQAKA